MSNKLHPYMRKEFWENEDNHFWEKDMYSERGKEEMREMTKRILKAFTAKQKADQIF